MVMASGDAVPSRDLARCPEFSPATFAFFAGLAASNTREWFAAHRAVYREAVDRPWRALIAAVAVGVAHDLPEVDAAVKTGHVLSRIQNQWPRPGLAYRTGLRASFTEGKGARGAGPRLWVSLDASGVRAGAELPLAGTAAARWLGRLDRYGGAACGVWDGPLSWWVEREAIVPAPAESLAACCRRLAAGRGSIRAEACWPALGMKGVVPAPAFARDVLAAVREAMPVYLAATEPDESRWQERTARMARGQRAEARGWAAAADAPAGGLASAPSWARPGGAGAVVLPGVEATAPVEGPAVGPEATRSGRDGLAAVVATRRHLARSRRTPSPGMAPGCPALPRSLRAAIARRASDEGVSPEAFIVFALACAVGHAD